MPIKTTRIIQSSPLTFGLIAVPKGGALVEGVITNASWLLRCSRFVCKVSEYMQSIWRERDVDGFSLGDGVIAH